MAQFSPLLQDRFQAIIDKSLQNRTKIKVLEAGCGSVSHIQFRKDKHVVGIDISEQQLKRNDYLNDKVLGDIQDHDFPSMSFDIIVCWDVFEHLSQPEKALHKFLDSIKHEGLIILKLPNLLSVKGLVTKYSPHWFHVLWYKHVYGHKEAGKNDKAPFKTYLKNTVSPNSLKQFAALNGVDIIFFELFEGSFLKSRNAVAYNIYKITKFIAHYASFGRLGDSEMILIIKK